LAKQIIEGESCQLTCFLVEVENNLGRSTVIDLGAKTDNKFKQIDHRSIDSITMRNVKYVLKKAGAKGEVFGEVAAAKDEPKWNFTNLAVGNWFSTTNYFLIKSIAGENVVTSCGGKDITVSKDILVYEMNNATVFAKEEKLCLTAVAE